MTRLVAQASRLVAVPGDAHAARLRTELPDVSVASIRLGQGTALSSGEAAAARSRARSRHGIPRDALVFGCYGGLSPDKRLPQILAAFEAVRPYVPAAHLLLAGSVPSHYDLPGDIARHGLGDSVTLTGYLPTDEAFTDAIAACDIALNLRWPTAREVSGPWLRGLAAGKPTVVIDLAHLTEVPTIDPRTWRPNVTAHGTRKTPQAPCAVAIDILDEAHSLRLAMRRLGTDVQLRASLGRAARAYWLEAHSIDSMVADYRMLVADAIGRPASTISLPPHLRDDGRSMLDRLLLPFGLPCPFASGAQSPIAGTCPPTR
jgi:glycosyltransferase involved in cell wall biosynthesis